MSKHVVCSILKINANILPSSKFLLLIESCKMMQTVMHMRTCAPVGQTGLRHSENNCDTVAQSDAKEGASPPLKCALGCCLSADQSE